jgi:hypothetical protein
VDIADTRPQNYQQLQPHEPNRNRAAIKVRPEEKAGTADYSHPRNHQQLRAHRPNRHRAIEVHRKEKADAPSDFPEGGKAAWSVVAGAWCCSFVSSGWVSCVGDFQSHYQKNELKAYSPGSISWIPSMQIFLLFGLAPIYGHVFDCYGPRPLLIGGTCSHIFGILMLSLSTKYYQIFLAQSICSAAGASAIFWAAGLTTSTWFQRRRGLSNGLATSGSSIGGVVGA